VIRHLEEAGHEQVIFLPDEYLAKNVARDTGMRIILPVMDGATARAPEDPEGLERVMIGWSGRCEVHEKFTVDDIERARRQFPDVAVLAHPECPPEVVEASDFSGSTTAMIRFVENMESGRYLLLTECSMGDNIASRNPDREMLRLCSVRCPHMNEITLEETLESLRQERYLIEVPEELSRRARIALDRMVALG
jgi:quinolinate synthase